MAPLGGRRVLVVRPDHLRDMLANDLARRGALVTDLVAYRTAPESPDSPAAQALYRMLLDGGVDAVTFTSATGVRRFADLHRPGTGRRPAEHDGRRRQSARSPPPPPPSSAFTRRSCRARTQSTGSCRRWWHNLDRDGGRVRLRVMSYPPKNHGSTMSRIVRRPGAA